MIARLNINGVSTKRADFLDLVLELENPNTHSIVVMYKEKHSLLRNKKTRYLRNNQGVWYRIEDKGVECSTRVRPIYFNGQPGIENY